jgi:hypothetical protein
VERNRESVSRAAISIALLAAALALVIWATGGFRTTVLGLRVSARDPLRAAGVAAASYLLALAVIGRRRALAIANDYLIAWSRVLRPVQANAEAVARVADQYGIAMAAVVLGALAALAVTAARAKPFWHDELFTVLISQMPFATMYRAAADGIDLAPPLNTALTRIVHGIGGVGLVTTRLTPIASFLAASALIFVTVRRRAGTLAALAAALLPAATMSWRYAYEARGYALSMACFAAALYGWFEAAEGRRVRLNLAIMACALGAGLWTHFYFVLAFIPIVAGEAVRQAGQRRVDIHPWTAIVLASLIALPLWPLVQTSYAQRATFWARPDADSPFVPRAQALYRALFDTPEQPLVATAARIVAALLAVELVACVLQGVRPRRPAAHYLAALGACLLLPAAGLLLGDYVGVFTERYVLFTIVGVVLALALALSWLAAPHGLPRIAAVVLMIVAGVHLGSRILSNGERSPNQLEKRPLLVDRLLRFPDPIVITGGVDYLEIWYGMPATVRSHALYLADPNGELRENRGDSVSRGFTALARWTPLPVVPIDEFVASHPRFWMYSSGPNWIQRSLIRRGATLIEHGQDQDNVGTLYDVRMDK